VGGKADSEKLEAALMGGLAAGAGVVLTEAFCRCGSPFAKAAQSEYDRVGSGAGQARREGI